uniref:Apyrase n=1 Tax=Heterorhabditis bacteriophora TaxID=37862 RepID=A0A1I7WVC3_HETBA
MISCIFIVCFKSRNLREIRIGVVLIYMLYPINQINSKFLILRVLHIKRAIGYIVLFYSTIILQLIDDPSHPSSPVASNSVAAFDLGGGSTQLTFWPEDFSIFEKYPQFERDISFFGNRLRLFIHSSSYFKINIKPFKFNCISFLGNGLVAARLNILYGSTEDKHEEKEQLTSSCLPDGYQISDWEYALKLWTINISAFKKNIVSTFIYLVSGLFNKVAILMNHCFINIYHQLCLISFFSLLIPNLLILRSYFLDSYHIVLCNYIYIYII